jgi:uncharacterized protein YajQ (UPF0234 family)
MIHLEADDDFRIKALWDVLQTKLIRRKVPLKNVQVHDPKPAAGGRVRQQIALQQSLPADTTRAIVKDIKGLGLMRVSSPSRDALQEVIAFLRSKDYGVELRFGNYRS